MLYHSFPRRRKNNNPPDKGLKILENILKYGLLLAPEILIYPGFGNESGEYILSQCRFSMTAIDNIEVFKNHAEAFGNIHIEFEAKDVYEMGAIPVIYTPKAEENSNSLWQIAASFIHRLSDFSKIVKMLEYLDKAADEFSNVDEINVNTETGLTKNLDVKQLRDTLDLILEEIINKDKKIEFPQMQGAIQGLISLFYYTDEQPKGKDINYLHYFRQREWRIIQGMYINGFIQDEDIVPMDSNNKESLKIRNSIIDVDSGFFNKELDYDFPSGRYKVIDLCRILRKIKKTDSEKGKSIQEYFNRILVPAVIYEQALVIAKESKFPKGKIIPYTNIEDVIKFQGVKE